jgi:small subunit ribosomal protein S10e
LVAKKDFNAPSHMNLHKIPNLQVIKACQSLNSRGYIKTQFSWQYYYYSLTDSGIGNASQNTPPFFPVNLWLTLVIFGLEYLREYLHIPPEIVPATHRKAPRPQREGATGGLRRREEGGAYRPPRREGGDEYRRRDDGGERPRFGGGFGRGRVAE